MSPRQVAHHKCVGERLMLSHDGATPEQLWDPTQPASLTTFLDHTACVYSAIWSPRHPHRSVVQSE